jgi:hypothetical protein
MKPIQAAWDPDINNDGRLDMVLGKPMAVVLNSSGAMSPVISFTVTFDGVTNTTYDDSDNVFTIWPIVPQNNGSFTITGSYYDGETHDLAEVNVTVKETAPLYVTYSYLYRATTKGKDPGPIEYALVDEADFNTMASMTTEMRNGDLGAVRSELVSPPTTRYTILIQVLKALWTISPIMASQERQESALAQLLEEL